VSPRATMRSASGGSGRCGSSATGCPRRQNLSTRDREPAARVSVDGDGEQKDRPFDHVFDVRRLAHQIETVGNAADDQCAEQRRPHAAATAEQALPPMTAAAIDSSNVDTIFDVERDVNGLPAEQQLRARREQAALVARPSCCVDDPLGLTRPSLVGQTTWG
jgi:hypothetical protein